MTTELDRISDESPPPLAPPRFTLRTLLLSMVAVGVLLAALKSMGSLAAALVLLMALAVAAHVAGNALGKRLRDHGGKGIAASSDPQRPAAPPSLSHEHFLPATNLSRRQSLGWPLWAAIGGGALVGGAIGAWMFVSTDAAQATWQDTTLGALAFALLGAMAGFLLGSFAQVVVRALREAGQH